MPPNSHNYCILTSKQFYTVQKAPEISSSEIFMNYAPPLKENSGSIKMTSMDQSLLQNMQTEVSW